MRRYQRISGLDNGEPIEDYIIDTQAESLEEHLSCRGDMSRHHEDSNVYEFMVQENLLIGENEYLFIEALTDGGEKIILDHYKHHTFANLYEITGGYIFDAAKREVTRLLSKEEAEFILMAHLLLD